MKRVWTEFIGRPLDGISGYIPAPGERLWVNNLYHVFERPVPTEQYGWRLPDNARFVHLSIKRNDREALHDWRDLQRIKNEIVGEEAEAVELYPAESRLVDNANQFHLWCIVGAQFPFGWATRTVSESSWQGSKQRPFYENERPDDCMTPEEVRAWVAAKLTEAGEVGPIEL